MGTNVLNLGGPPGPNMAGDGRVHSVFFRENGSFQLGMYPRVFIQKGLVINLRG